MASDNRGKKLSGGGQGFNEPNRNESIALLQTQHKFCRSGKTYVEFALICTKKETGRSPGGNTTG